MGQYAVRRFLLIFPTLIIASLIVAALLRLMPGDAVMQALRESRGGVSLADSKEGLEIARAKVGLKDPFLVQYMKFVFGWPVDDGAVYQSKDDGESWKPAGRIHTEPIDALSFISTAKGIGIGGKFVWGTKDAGQVWTAYHLHDIALNSVAYGDEDNAWAVGDEGTILYSATGGVRRHEGQHTYSTFLPQESGATANLLEVDFADAERGWVVGAGGTILKTSDGGGTWQSVNSGVDEDLLDIEFLDDGLTGFATGKAGTLLTTFDGGETWTSAPLDVSNDLLAIGFDNPASMWVVGGGGLALNSIDGGLTWQERQLTYAADDGSLMTVDGDITAIAFAVIEEETGQTAGFAATADSMIFRTLDGGLTWERKSGLISRRVGSESIEEPLSRPVRDVSLRVTSQGKTRLYGATSGKIWQWGVLGGDWGTTIVGNRSVWADLARAFPPTLQLMIMTVVVSTSVAIPLGVLSAVRQDTAADYLGRFIAIFGLAVPSFWLATLILIFPAIWLDFSPPLEYVGFNENPVKNLLFFALPVGVAGIFGSASVMRMTRSMMLEVLRQDYIRTAWSKGLQERLIISRHALKNAMIPVITIVGMQIPFLLGNQVVIERIFNIPGLGRILVEGTSTRDYTLVQGIVFFLSFFIIVSNLIVDLTYGWLDPRIRYE